MDITSQIIEPCQTIFDSNFYELNTVSVGLTENFSENSFNTWPLDIKSNIITITKLNDLFEITEVYKLKTLKSSGIFSKLSREF